VADQGYEITPSHCHPDGRLGRDYSRDLRQAKQVQPPMCGAKILSRRCRLWVISVVLGAPADVRFYPNSDRLLRRREMTLCANSDQSAAQQKGAYSINLSAELVISSL
jgi:hypothetical protein